MRSSPVDYHDNIITAIKGDNVSHIIAIEYFEVPTKLFFKRHDQLSKEGIDVIPAMGDFETDFHFAQSAI